MTADLQLLREEDGNGFSSSFEGFKYDDFNRSGMPPKQYSSLMVRLDCNEHLRRDFRRFNSYNHGVART